MSKKSSAALAQAIPAARASSAGSTRRQKVESTRSPVAYAVFAVHVPTHAVLVALEARACASSFEEEEHPTTAAVTSERAMTSR